MKKLTILLLAIFAVVALASCDKDELGPVMSSDPGAPSITSPESGQSYDLTADQAEDTLLTFEWTEPDYGFPSAPTFAVEMSMAGDFSDAVELGTTNQTALSVVVSGMNNTLLSSGATANQTFDVAFRVISNISDSVDQQVSEPITLSFTPYLVDIQFPEIYVPGGYQSASGYTNDWSPADAPPLFSVNSNDKYEGYVYIANDNSEFKFTKERNWDLNWGDDGGDGTLEENGVNIPAATAGYYKINVDLNTLTYETLNTDWGLIGSATPDGWDSDQDMSYDPDTKVWTITLDLTAAELKFRANDAWDLNYGDDEGDGTLEAGGGNIPVSEAGNYTVTLDLSDAPYTYSLTKN
ncbi:MAG: SusE domain-containing protein [Balneolaceae bacterium]|nr:SusE domain-containing protein [Balneolaceae bacterium]